MFAGLGFYIEENASCARLAQRIKRHIEEHQGKVYIDPLHPKCRFFVVFAELSAPYDLVAPCVEPSLSPDELSAMGAWTMSNLVYHFARHVDAAGKTGKMHQSVQRGSGTKPTRVYSPEWIEEMLDSGYAKPDLGQHVLGHLEIRTSHYPEQCSRWQSPSVNLQALPRKGSASSSATASSSMPDEDVAFGPVRPPKIAAQTPSSGLPVKPQPVPENHQATKRTGDCVDPYCLFLQSIQPTDMRSSSTASFGRPKQATDGSKHPRPDCQPSNVMPAPPSDTPLPGPPSEDPGVPASSAPSSEANKDSVEAPLDPPPPPRVKRPLGPEPIVKLEKIATMAVQRDLPEGLNPQRWKRIRLGPADGETQSSPPAIVPVAASVGPLAPLAETPSLVIFSQNTPEASAADGQVEAAPEDGARGMSASERAGFQSPSGANVRVSDRRARSEGASDSSQEAGEWASDMAAEDITHDPMCTDLPAGVMPEGQSVTSTGNDSQDTSVDWDAAPVIVLSRYCDSPELRLSSPAQNDSATNEVASRMGTQDSLQTSPPLRTERPPSKSPQAPNTTSTSIAPVVPAPSLPPPTMRTAANGADCLAGVGQEVFFGLHGLPLGFCTAHCGRAAWNLDLLISRTGGGVILPMISATLILLPLDPGETASEAEHLDVIAGINRTQAVLSDRYVSDSLEAGRMLDILDYRIIAP